MTGRLFAIGLEGPSLSPREREILSAVPPWGVVLFRRNLESVPELDRLAGQLRALDIPHLLLDQEGGPVDRLRDLVAPAPSLGRLAATGGARRAGLATGAMLARLGFDVDLAPVVDRAVEGAGSLVLGERCASADPKEIIDAAGGFLEGLQARGVGGCLKHFPGLGRATLDTHAALPVVSRDPVEEVRDLEPFRALMDRAAAIMVSHAAGPDGTPASLSPEVATRWLRGALRFAGAAFSDDLEMGALSGFGDLPRRCALASAAGCDLLLVCRRLEEYPACVEAIERDVPAERRAEAAARLDGYAAHLERLSRSAGPPRETLADVRAEFAALA
ncbi:MAG: glycoside hydrolase family 3 N-terminal domain-containing protein [Syntrophomonadaceae bacterium]